MGDAFRPCVDALLPPLPPLPSPFVGQLSWPPTSSKHPPPHASHASTGFLEGGHPHQSEGTGDRRWNVGTRQLFCHRKQEVGISHIVQDQSYVLHCHARRSGSGPSSRRAHIACELGLVKVERHLRNKVQDKSGDRVTRFRRSPLWILECIQSPTVPWCEAGPFQCLSPVALLTTRPSVQILLWCVAQASSAYCLLCLNNCNPL